jgi:cellulose biosynthesis protein BcsQ
MDAEYQQEMGSLFSNVKSMRNNSAMAYNLDAQNPYATVKSEIIHDIVDVIPPISQNIMMYGITFDLLINTLEGAKRSGDYDYVIADTDSCFSPEKLRLIQKADVLIIPTTQELMAIKKTCAFLNGLDTNGRSKTLLVCNYVDKNMYSKNEEQFERQGYRVEARIYFDAGIKEKTAEEYASIPDFIALSYLVK